LSKYRATFTKHNLLRLNSDLIWIENL